MTFGRLPLRRFVVDACDGPFGSSLKSEHYSDSGARVVRLGNIGNGEWNDEDAAFLPLDYWETLSRHHAMAGDLLVAGLGDENHPLGRACVMPDLGPALVKADCYRLRLDPARADPKFVALFLSSAAGGAEALRLAEGSTRSRLTLGKALSIPLPDVPLRDQRAIADYLDAEVARIDALVDARHRSAVLARERFESMVWRSVTKGLAPAPMTPSGIGWVGEMPAAWDAPAVGHVFEVQLGKMLNPEATASGEMYPYLRNENVQWDDLDLEDLNLMHFDEADRSRYELRSGDLLVCEGGEVGRAAMWRGELSPCFYQKALHRVRVRRPANTRFLMYVLRGAAGRGVFANEGNTSTIVHLTAEKLRAHRFPCPPTDEQDLIVEELDRDAATLSAAESALDRQIDLLLERRQALITAAVTGQLEIPGVAA